MNIVQYTNEMKDYLSSSEVIDFADELIMKLSDRLLKQSEDEIEYIKLAYEYVRDHIYHSADVNNDSITCTASEVLKAGHGICFAKSHLLG